MASTTHISGTAAVANGSTTVTGTGSLWKSARLREGDLFAAKGLAVRIASITNNTTMVLAEPWPGATLPAGSAYEVRFAFDGERGLSSLTDVMAKLNAPIDSAEEAIAAAASATQSATDANTAKVAAQTAKTAAETAKTAAETAKTASETARDTAVTKAGEASTSATNANTAKVAAETAKTASETARDASVAAKTASETARDASVTAKTASETARDASVTAKTASETAKTAAETAAGTATTKASEASTSATNANTAKVAAEDARDTANQHKLDAQAAKTAAETAAGTATTKAGEASTSAADAAQALADAEALVAALEGGPVASVAGVPGPDVSLAELEGAGVALTANTATAAQGVKADTAVQPGDTHAALGKATPVDADELTLFDSVAAYVRKKLTFSNLKATLKTYFDTVYQPTHAQLTLLTTLSRSDGNFIVGDGINWVVESGATARNSLGLGSAATANTGTASGNVPVLDGSGKLNTSVIAGLTTSMFAANVIDTDGTLAANSATRIPAQSAVKSYIDSNIEAANALQYKGALDCSTNPNYPAANAGHMYVVSVAGKIGGASGITVDAGDVLFCKTDSTASGTEATVGAQWNIIQFNLVGALTAANIGVSVQAYDGDLNAISGLTYVANDMVYWTGPGAVAKQATTSFGRGLLNLADGVALRSAASAQLASANLTALDVASTATGRSLLNIADAAAGRTVLALGTMATQASSNYAALAGAAFTGAVSVGSFTLNANGTEGGEMRFKYGTSKGSLAGTEAILDVVGNTYRMFDNGTGFRGLQFDMWNQTIASLNGTAKTFLNTADAATVTGAWTHSANVTMGNAAQFIISGQYGASLFKSGTGDGASYTTHNIILKGWFGMGMAAHDDTIQGYYDFRTGTWDVKGGYKINGVSVLTGSASVFTNGFTEELGIISVTGAYTLSSANGACQDWTLTGNATITMPADPAAGYSTSYTIGIFQDATGGRTVSFGANVKWDGDVAPTLTGTANRGDILCFTFMNGKWYGSLQNKNVTV